MNTKSSATQIDTSPSTTPVANHPAMAGTHACQTGIHDFDFLIGNWVIENHKLKSQLQGCDDWETFTATQQVQALPGSIGNFDDFVAPAWRPGFVGMSLRIFNPETGLWSIYWLNNKNGGIDAESGALTPPVTGRFENGTGIFEGRDQVNGIPILVRYTWSGISNNSARWEQAFSSDAGQSWETNWTMQMTRSMPASA